MPPIPDELKHLNWVWFDDPDDAVYGISVDEIGDATYVAAWDLEKVVKIGELYTRTDSSLIYDDDEVVEGEFLGISFVTVEGSYRNEGLATEMYNALIRNLHPRYAGISSYLPDRVQTRHIPQIWASLGSQILGDHEILRS